MPQVRRLTLRYEDMLADGVGTFTSALRTMFPDDEPNPERVRAAVEASSFGNLKAQEAAANFKERPPKSEAFFRSGKSGGWQEHLTPTQCARLANALAPAMERLGYKADGTVGGWAGSEAA
jgi:hypothetical protein